VRNHLKSILLVTEKQSRSSHRASFDFAQDEDELYVPLPLYLILSEVAIRDAALRRLLMVRGRTAPMQMLQELCTPGAFAG
jgi:hypothetical protein